MNRKAPQQQKPLNARTLRAQAEARHAKEIKTALAKTGFYLSFQGFLNTLLVLAGMLILVGVGVFIAYTQFGFRFPLGTATLPPPRGYVSKLPAWAQEMPTTYSARTALPWYPVNNEGYFYWDSKPAGIRAFTYEELDPRDQAFCDWLKNTGTTFKDHDGNKAEAKLNRELCALAITVEAWGGEPASLSLAKKRTESGNGTKTTTSYAGAEGLMQFMHGTFHGNNGAKGYKPWPKADSWIPLDAWLGATNLDRAAKIEAKFLKARNDFIRKFYASWNKHTGQANAVYELGWKLQLARESFWFGGVR